MTRNEVLIQACEQCLKELYSKAQPSITWEEFEEENKIYIKKYREWQRAEREGNHIDLTKYCGPRPYEFYYLPKDVLKNICDSYVDAYKIDSQKNLLDIIEVLKNYCNNPIIDIYEKDEDGIGHRSYMHPDNLEKELEKILHNTSTVRIIQDKFFEFLNMAGDFYNWNYDLNSFNTTVYLGASPCSNKETVINNWKQYRNKDIEIDESIYNEED